MCQALKDWAEEERVLGYEEGERLGRAEGERLGQAEVFRLITNMFSAGESAEAVKRIAEDEKFFKDMQKKYLCV